MNVVKFFLTTFLQITCCLYYLAPYKTEPVASWRSEGPALGPMERGKKRTIPIPRLKIQAITIDLNLIGWSSLRSAGCRFILL